MDIVAAKMLVVLFTQTTVLLIVTAQHNLTPFGTANQSSRFTSSGGNPEDAILPPISNIFSFNYCSHTDTGRNDSAWWMFHFSLGSAYITDVTIYYREEYANRMDGFKLYVTNTPTIPPDGYLCYEDTDPGEPNITQTIPCYELGKYVIYYDATGSIDAGVMYGPVIELCYVALNGCMKGTWGTNCTKACPSKCSDQHCYPGNGSCILGCETENCLNDICHIHTGVCTEGCVTGWTGQYCTFIKK